MNLEELKVELEDAYLDYQQSTQKYREQARNVADMNFRLKNSILDAYANDEIEGKNQTQRDAAERKMFGSQMNVINEEEKRKDLYYQKREQAQIQLDYIRDLLRIEEIIAQTS